MGTSAPKIDLPVAGDKLAGKYDIVRVVGEGGMGVVYEARHLRLRQRVALKVLLPTLLAAADVVERFEREGRLAAQLRGRHVASVLDVDVTPAGLPYIVMEYLEGRDLDAELAERGPLPVKEAVHYVLQACEAMKEAHALGIVHRDLKPANLFLCPGKEGAVLKVLDFGISKAKGEDDARLTGTHATVGTPLYMSPEQVRSAKNVDLRTDIWSLGVILFELLAGRPPFQGSTTGAAAAIVIDAPPSLCELRPEVSPPLEAVVLRALEKSPANRYADVEAFAAALAPFAAGYVPPPRAAPEPHESAKVLPPTSGDAGSGPGLGIDSTFAGAATVSSDAGANPGSGPALPHAPSATAPGWTRGRAQRPKHPYAIVLILIAPLASVAGLVLMRQETAPTRASVPAAVPPPAAVAPVAPVAPVATAAAATPASDPGAATAPSPAATPAATPAASPGEVQPVASASAPRPARPAASHAPAHKPAPHAPPPASPAPQGTARPLYLP